MLRINKTSRKFVSLQQKTMRESGYWERRDLQEMICRSPQEFCDELGEAIHIVGTEVIPDGFVKDRIDLLAVDNTGAAVIIELKRDSHKLQLLQTLAYAGMVSKWPSRRFIEELNKFNRTFYPEAVNQTVEQARDELEELLDDGDSETINRNQRILLVAEKFDYEVLITAEWLTERYGLDIRCYRISLSQHEADEFLSCNRAYPPPELTEVAVRRRRSTEGVVAGTSSWEEISRALENSAELEFVTHELAAARPNNVDQAYFTYRLASKRRFIVYIKKKFATVRQLGRFDGDEQYWRARLSEPTSVAEKRDRRDLRFRLVTSGDFQAFTLSWTQELQTKTFSEPGEEDLLDQEA
ncbi:hypothetical protein ACVWYQ_004742 [Bradyrhizobium sp. USDA 3397]